MAKYSKLSLADLDEALMSRMSVDEIFEMGAREVPELEDL